MADSDEECDRKKRDKFRRERSDYSGERRKGDYDKRAWREDYHESRRRSSRDDDDDRGDRERRRHASPHGRRDWSPPPMKRQRREGWENVREYPGMGMMPPYGMMERRSPWMVHDMPHGSPMGGPRGMHGEMMMGFSPLGDARKRGGTMLTFKQFLSQQDDNIDDQEAIQLYAEYKADFKKQQLHQFFNDHKEEDWFLAKYHPTRVNTSKVEVAKNTLRRVDVFLWLMEHNLLDQVPLTIDKTDEIIRIMNTAVILMEGGDEHDLLSLDLPPPTAHKTGKAERDPEQAKVVTSKPSDEVKKRKSSQESKEVQKNNDDKSGSPSKPSFMVEEPSPEVQKLMQQAKDYQRQMQRNDGSAQKKKKRKELYSFDGEEDTETSDEDIAPPGTTEDDMVGEGDGQEEPPPPGLEQEKEDETQSTTESQEEEAPPPEEKQETGEGNGVESDGEVMEVPSPEQMVACPAPRPLHITKAVYLRHLPPNISQGDILELVKSIPGYLRMAFAEPQPDKGYERRGWVTFSYEVDIKDICSHLMENKVKETQMSCIVNRDLTRRVKSGVEASWSKRVLLEDVQLLLRVIHVLDKKAELWEHASNVDKSSTDGETNDVVEQPRKNPVTVISDSLLSGEDVAEEAMEEEEEEGVVIDPGTEMVPIGSQLIKTVDQLIWYLRIVHSLDYFNGVVFPSEDHMPHRLGIITARAGKPTSLSVDEVNEHLKTMEANLKPHLTESEALSEEALERLGKRDQEAEVEKFIEVNTQKQSEQKYLCPLSGKKFKGPEFVRKHIFNKHLDKVEEVKLETEFFNNYLKDPNRPVPLDSSTVVSSSTVGIGGSASKPPSKPQADESGGGWGQSPMMMGGYPDMGGMGYGMRRGGMRGRRPRGYFRGGRGRRIHQYNDLDNPEEMY